MAHLPEFLELYFPHLHAAIDWTQPPEWKNQELNELKLEPNARTKNIIDLLAKVRLRDRTERIIYLHLEVQSHPLADFARRTFHCFHGISRATGLDVVSAAILADLKPGWKPDTYRYQCLGCEVEFRFPVCKLLERIPEWEGRQSLPALAARAQIAALRHRGNPAELLKARFSFIKDLRRQKFTQGEILNIHRMLSQMIQLPRKELLQFRHEVAELTKEENMTKLSDIELLYIEEGREEGLQKGREEGLSQGEWIGKIQLLEELMGIAQSPRTTLEKKSVKQLCAQFSKLEAAYHRKHRK